MKNKKQTTVKNFKNQTKANIITYMVQDLLDSFSYGNKFIFTTFEKEVYKIITSKD